MELARAALGTSVNMKWQKCIFANSATWIDKKTPNCTFALIEPGTPANGSTKIVVNVSQYGDTGAITTLYQDSLSI